MEPNRTYSQVVGGLTINEVPPLEAHGWFALEQIKHGVFLGRARRFPGLKKAWFFRFTVPGSSGEVSDVIMTEEMITTFRQFVEALHPGYEAFKFRNLIPGDGRKEIMLPSNDPLKHVTAPYEPSHRIQK